MTTHSTDGREWAKLSTLKPGDKVRTDSGFTCGINDKILVVKKSDDGELYVDCDEGGHRLEGQVSGKDNDHLVGVWLA